MTGWVLRISMLPAVVLGAAVLVALVALIAAPAEASRGLLAGWIAILGVCVGAAVLAHVHALTGGIWREAGEPRLSALARLTPLVSLGGLALIVLAGAIYPWAGATAEGSYRVLWLNWPFFGIRLALILVFWSAMGIFAARPRHRRNLVAPAGFLIGHGFAVSIFGNDMVLSLLPGFTSTVYGAFLAVLQVASALALVALLGLGGPQRGVRDWAGLLLAAIGGASYLVAMQYLVIWYGNLPAKVVWYLERLDGAGGWLAAAAALCGLVLPLALLLSSDRRSDPDALRLPAGLVLAGVMALWLFDVDAAAAGILAGLALPAAAAAFVGVPR